MKKLLTLCAAVLMAFAVTGSVMAADAVSVYVEPANATYVLFQSPPIQCRAILLDAAGKVATTFGGAQIGDSVLELKSANFGAAVIFDPTSPVNIDNSGIQTFTVAYDADDITEPGDDLITVTLKKGTTTIFNTIPVKVLAPAANSYVTRTGLSDTLLPDVLETIPNPQANNGSILTAGSSVDVTVIAAFGRDTNFDNLYDTYLFTDNVPEDMNAVNISGTTEPGGTVAISSGVTGTLDKGIAKVNVAVSNLKIPDILIKSATSAAQAAKMNTLLDPAIGVVVSWTASGTVTREVGNYNNAPIVDTDGEDVIVDQLTATLGYAFQFGTAFAGDTSAHKPAPVKLVTIVGLPVNDEDGDLSTIYADGISASDAYNLLIDRKSKPSTFQVNGDTGIIAGAIVGYDQFDNPAPFTPGANAAFDLAYTNTVPDPDTIDPLPLTPVANWSTSAADGDATAAFAYSAFVPFVMDADREDVFIEDADVAETLFSNVNAPSLGVSFSQSDDVTTVDLDGTNTIGTINVGDDNLTLTVTAENPPNPGESYTLYIKNKVGKTVKINTKDSTSGLDSLTIPRDGSNDFAEQDIVFFTKVKTTEFPIFLILQGKTSKTILNQRIDLAGGGTGIAPADPGDFPPIAVIATIKTIKAVVDTDISEIRVSSFPVPAVVILDAFNNSYSSNATLEDADPTLTVVKADGTTPYPGADTDIDGNNIFASFKPADVTAANGDPVLKIAAGAASASITLKVRALVATSLKNTFIPIIGNDGEAVDTPVKLNFVDQNGRFISPDTGSPAYEVDVKAEGGTTSAGDDFTQALCNASVGGPECANGPSFTFTATLDDTNTTKIMTIEADGGDADAGKTTLTLDFNADFTPPTIGTVTAGACSFSIAITDNKAVNLTKSTVIVKNGATGEDITSTLTRTDVGNGTPTGSIDFTTNGTGSFVLDIVAFDAANNKSAEIRTIEVSSCPGADCLTVDPAFVRPGETTNVIITASGTNFAAGTKVTFSCAGITVNSTTANSATELTVNITAAASAVAAPCEISVVPASGKSVTCDDKFAIVTTPPSCASVIPASVDAGFTGDVTVTLKDINLTGATGVAVSFGCGGVTVNSSTVTGATTVKANITVAPEALGSTCDVTVTGGATGSVGVICKGAFTVVPEVPCTITVAPTSVQTGFFFPRTTNLTITGSGGCEFDSTTTVTISGNVTVQSVKVDSATKLTVTIQTRPVLLGGKGSKTVTVKTGDETVTGTFTVKGLFF